MHYPGERVQGDVKVVPSVCTARDAKIMEEHFYQYTAIDEYSRFRFVAAFKGQSTYSSVQFLDMLIKAFPFKIECIQTDNGMEFIKSFDEHKKGKLYASLELAFPQRLHLRRSPRRRPALIFFSSPRLICLTNLQFEKNIKLFQTTFVER